MVLLSRLIMALYLEEIATKDGIIGKFVHDFEFTREMNILKV